MESLHEWKLTYTHVSWCAHDGIDEYSRNARITYFEFTSRIEQNIKGLISERMGGLNMNIYIPKLHKITIMWWVFEEKDYKENILSSMDDVINIIQIR